MKKSAIIRLLALGALCFGFVPKRTSLVENILHKVSPVDSSYLFVYFTGNGKGEEAIRFALSKDGYNFKALNSNQPVISLQK